MHDIRQTANRPASLVVKHLAIGSTRGLNSIPGQVKSDSVSPATGTSPLRRSFGDALPRR